jgi:hypothetical protein
MLVALDSCGTCKDFVHTYDYLESSSAVVINSQPTTLGFEVGHGTEIVEAITLADTVCLDNTEMNCVDGMTFYGVTKAGSATT